MQWFVFRNEQYYQICCLGEGARLEWLWVQAAENSWSKVAKTKIIVGDAVAQFFQQFYFENVIFSLSKPICLCQLRYFNRITNDIVFFFKAGWCFFMFAELRGSRGDRSRIHKCHFDTHFLKVNSLCMSKFLGFRCFHKNRSLKFNNQF